MAVTLHIPELEALLVKMERLEARMMVLEGEKNAPVKEWFTLKEAAAFLNLSEITVRRKIWEGELKRSGACRHIRIHREELERYKRFNVYSKR